MLTVENLNKRYANFHLKDISFSLEQGYIMGFIGINGAGKTTTLKSMLNMVHAESGSVNLLGKDFISHETELKEQLGIFLGDTDIYKRNKIRTITDVIKRFYSNWDDDLYNSYCNRFKLAQDKALKELSQGMRTKYFLTLALSHNARLFILDEPTSGLDPAARDELLEIFQQMVESGERSILFSTHITSDLEKCADYITYIHDGRLIGSDNKDDFIHRFRLIQGGQNRLTPALKKFLVSYKEHSFGFSGLVDGALPTEYSDLQPEIPNLEEIMIYFAKKEKMQ